MREIKFRCWVKELRDGDIVMPGFMDYDPDWQNVSAIRREIRTPIVAFGVDDIQHECARLNNIFKQSDTLMQFTGLKDKNGKEIYEGDIISGNLINQFGSSVKGVPGKVIWNETTAGFATELPNHPDVYYIGRFVEIVGNIYENPELLNEDRSPKP